MNDIAREQLSSFADGETTNRSTSKLVDDIYLNAEVRSKWFRYQVAKSAMKQELPDQIDTAFLDNLMTALEDEPTVLAPRKTQVSTFKRYGKQAIGIGVAASLVAIAILGLDQWLGSPINGATGVPVATAPKSSTTGAPKLAMDSSAESKSASTVRVNSYLIDHSQYVSRVGLKPVERALDSGNKSIQK